MGQTVRFFIVLLLFFSPCFKFSAWAGGDELQIGAARMGMGGAFTAVGKNFWSMYANPAGIAGVDAMTAGLHIEQRFFVAGLNYGAFGFVTPFKEKHYLGIDGSSYGFSNYRESRVGVNYATTLFDRLSMGAKFNYAIISIPNYGSKGTFFVDAGIIGNVAKGFNLGFKVYNANQAPVNKETNERVPTILSFGASYELSDKVLLVSDLEKNVNFPLSYKGGIQYAFVDHFKARVGVSTAPVTFNAGLGFTATNLVIDVATSLHQQLGFSSFLSVSYRFNQKANSN